MLVIFIFLKKIKKYVRTYKIFNAFFKIQDWSCTISQSSYALWDSRDRGDFEYQNFFN